MLINPYISTEGNQARIVARIKDSDHTLIRNDLLNKIESDINASLVTNGETLRLSGISVLYNNVLQSLFQSQIVTLGTVFICILLMLLILFRNFLLAVIGTVTQYFYCAIYSWHHGSIGHPSRHHDNNNCRHHNRYRCGLRHTLHT